MKLQEALRLLDIVTDVNGQYSKEERMRAAMRLEELLRMLTFVIILGFVMLIGASINEAKRSGNTTAKVIATVLIFFFLFFLLSLV